MENEKKIGGKRKGAGRKPVLNKKKQISLYVEGGKVLKFGNEEKMKQHLYKLIDEYGNVPFSEKVYDAPSSQTKIGLDELPMFTQPKSETTKVLNLSYFVTKMAYLDKDDTAAILALKEEAENSTHLNPNDKRNIIYGLQTGNY